MTVIMWHGDGMFKLVLENTIQNVVNLMKEAVSLALAK